MLSQKMTDAINVQINNEMFAAYLYMAMSAQCSAMSFNGFAKWFMVQYHEEMFHAMKFYQYLTEQDAVIGLKTLKEPAQKFEGIVDMFSKSYAQEKGTTKNIRDLMDIAVAEKDYASQNLLNWYIVEQVEEEKSDTEILAKIALIGNNPAGTLLLDAELGKRELAAESNFTKLSEPK